MSKRTRIEAAANEFVEDAAVQAQAAFGSTSDFAQDTIDQAQTAFDKASDIAQDNFQTVDAATVAFKASATDLQMKSVEIAQANMAAMFAFARKVFAVKDPSAFFQLNQDFARDQAQAFQKQAAEMNELAMALAKETLKPVQDGFAKAFVA